MTAEQMKEALKEAAADIDAAIDYAKQKGLPAPMRTRLRAVRTKLLSAAYQAEHIRPQPVMERAIARVVIGWHKLTGRA